jgi:hypothetical protein
MAWLLGAWGLATVVAGGQLMAPHLLAFRTPTGDEARDAALATLRPEGAGAGWTAFHVLYASCGCSVRVLEHLADSERPANLQEVVLWVGAPSGHLAALQRRGFRVVMTDPDELASRYHVEAAPLLVAIDERGQARYAGGYTSRKQGPAIQDRELLAQARAGGAPASLPLFGCAVSDRLRALVTPLPI